ncbi:hypothetical protein [Agriterribacter sp.]|uniref:hypothetical protein n=1 Tax=Agriterribacter sp. TaxID=2821509 RepID=UPI002C409F35|nr:hypothetical protein [Agriterribacter sp.]HRP58543.1 hypothetical protein [Agriterribacter sp.]
MPLITKLLLKKIVTIFMLAVYLFNLAGYSFVFQLMINHSNRQTVAAINTGGYSNADLVHIKIPLLLPYSTNWSDYERYDGEVEYEGLYYKYVKRRIYNDTLHLLCLPDFKRTRLQSAEENYARQVNNVNAASGEKTTTLGKKNVPASEYDQTQMLCIRFAMSPALPSFHDFISPSLTDTDSDCLIQPPDGLA